MYNEDSLFETIMSLNHTEIPYQSEGRPRKQKNINEQKNKKRRESNTITTDLEGLYRDLVEEGSRIDITIKRRLEIRNELTLIRKHKRLMDQEIQRQIEYDL